MLTESLRRCVRSVEGRSGCGGEQSGQQQEKQQRISPALAACAARQWVVAGWHWLVLCRIFGLKPLAQMAETKPIRCSSSLQSQIGVELDVGVRMRLEAQRRPCSDGAVHFDQPVAALPGKNIGRDPLYPG